MECAIATRQAGIPPAMSNPPHRPRWSSSARTAAGLGTRRSASRHAIIKATGIPIIPQSKNVAAAPTWPGMPARPFPRRMPTAPTPRRPRAAQPHAHAAARTLHSEIGMGHGVLQVAHAFLPVLFNLHRQECLCHQRVYFARSTQMISLSLRTNILFWAKAGWHHTTLRPKTALVGAITLARSISS